MNNPASTTSSPVKPSQYVISLKLNAPEDQRIAINNFQSYVQVNKHQRPSTAGVGRSFYHERLKNESYTQGRGDTDRKINDRYMVKTIENKGTTQRQYKQPTQSYDEKDYLKLTQSYCLRTFEKKNEKHRLLLGKSISDWSAADDKVFGSNRITIADRKKYEVAEEMINSRDSNIGMYRRIIKKKQDEFVVSEQEKQEMRKRLGRLIENQKISQQNKQITDYANSQGDNNKQQDQEQFNQEIVLEQHSKRKNNIYDSSNKKPAALTLLLSKAHDNITNLMSQELTASLNKSELLNKSTRNSSSNRFQTLQINDRKQSIFIGQSSFYNGKDDDQGYKNNYSYNDTRRNTIQSSQVIPDVSVKELFRKIPKDSSFTDVPVISKKKSSLENQNLTNFTMVYTSKKLKSRQLRKSCNGIGQQQLIKGKETEKKMMLNLKIDSKDNDLKMYSQSVQQSPVRKNPMNSSIQQWNFKIKEDNILNNEEFELEQRMNKAWQVDKNGELQLQVNKPNQMKREVYSSQRAQKMIASLRVTFLTFLRKCDILSVDPIQALDNHYFDRKPLSRPGSFILFVSIREKQEDFALELLQKDRQLIYEKDERLQNPLHAALSNGMKRLALWLIHNGVDFEQRDLANKTPLYYSLSRGMLEVTKYLLFKRANPWAESKTYRYETITYNNAIISCFKKSKQADLCWRMSHNEGTQKQIWLKKRCFLYTYPGCEIKGDLDCLTKEEQQEVAKAKISQIEQERIENSLSYRTSDYYHGLLSKKGRIK